jgi:hypothetical protein
MVSIAAKLVLLFTQYSQSTLTACEIHVFEFLDNLLLNKFARSSSDNSGNGLSTKQANMFLENIHMTHILLKSLLKYAYKLIITTNFLQ